MTPAEVSPLPLQRLLELHDSGATHAAIAAAPNADGYRTPTGFPWRPRSVARTITALAYPNRAQEVMSTGVVCDGPAPVGGVA